MEHNLLNKMTSWIPWSRIGKRPSEGSDEEDEPNLLLSLIHPDVTNIVLDNLDPKSLLSLRLVSRRSKSWVDHPRYLSKLRITLHSSAGSKKMRKVLRSKTDFCNFRIGHEKRKDEDLILEFALRFGPTLKTLDINTMTTHSTTINLLSNCASLASLTLLGINLTKLGQADIDDLNRENVRRVLGTLESLSVGNILFLEEREMAYFKAFIGHCTSLQSLRLPYVNFQSKRPKEVRDFILGRYVINPVIKLIRSRGCIHHQEQNQRPNCNCCCNSTNMKYLILEYLNPLPSPLFLKVADVCYEFFTILHNVHESHLKKLDLSSTNPDYHQDYLKTQRIQEIIGTLDGLNSNVVLERLINLKCISIWVSSALQLSERNLDNPVLPSLANINLYVDTVDVEEDVRISRLMSAVLGTPRRTVESLKISYNSRKGAVSAELVKAVDIAANFQYLRKLDIYQWDAFDEEFVALWKGLGSHRIRDLSLLLCTNLSDRGLLGSDPKKPAILALTGLKELHISSLYGSITDATIHRALRHIPLLKLRLYSQSITYDGIASLMDGICSTTIEYIHFSKPLDCTQKEFYYLVKDIINAKNYPEADFPKRRHLRRRSQPLVFYDQSDDDDD